jgi:hypothetical protein
LVPFLAVLILSAKSSAYRASLPTSGEHAGQAGHSTAYMQASSSNGSVIPATLAERRRVPMTTTIDGARNPELIPDAVAYGHFIRATASSAARREAFLTRAGLTPAERATYVQALGAVGVQLESAKQKRRAAGPSVLPAELQSLKAAEKRAVADAEMRIRQTLPTVAMAKLNAHIQGHVKRRIKMFSGPKMQ